MTRMKTPTLRRTRCQDVHNEYLVNVDENHLDVLCDFPGCGHLYLRESADVHLSEHYGGRLQNAENKAHRLHLEKLVCQIENHDGTQCGFTARHPSKMWDHRQRSHNGKHDSTVIDTQMPIRLPTC